MNTLLQNLRAFNRRERFFVVGWALDNPQFTLGDGFREHVARDTGIQVPPDAFCAMDFPLDWIKGCLWLTKSEKEVYSVLETGDVNERNDDVDLLVAFEEEEVTHLLMIEAKGVTGWHNAQLRGKAERLGLMFGMGETSTTWPSVNPIFVMASPKKSQQIDVEDWPLWMKSGNEPKWWLELSLPPDLRKIVRCDETGMKKWDGKYWKVV